MYLAFPYQFIDQTSSIENSIAHFRAHFYHQSDLQSTKAIHICIMILLSAQWPHALSVQQCFTQSKSLYHSLYPQHASTQFTEDDFVEVISYMAVREHILSLMTTAPSLYPQPPNLKQKLPLKILQSNLSYLDTVSDPNTPQNSKKRHVYLNNLYHTPVMISDDLVTLIPYLTGDYTCDSLQRVKTLVFDREKLLSLIQEAYNLALLKK